MCVVYGIGVNVIVWCVDLSVFDVSVYLLLFIDGLKEMKYLYCLFVV